MAGRKLLTIAVVFNRRRALFFAGRFSCECAVMGERRSEVLQIAVRPTDSWLESDRDKVLLGSVLGMGRAAGLAWGELLSGQEGYGGRCKMKPMR